ncbi:MAG TPA: DUF2071 domain-containing protein [Vicinamibacterales bacterium]|jgi:hypothetical protein
MLPSTDELAQSVIQRNANRGIPMPDKPWASYQSWDNLLTCHWPLDPAVLRPKVPAQLEIDTYDGQAWIALIPMFMGTIKLRDFGIPTEPHFPEINFRTYVRYGGRTGVYFFHVDAEALLVDIGARLFFHTPYEPAEVSLQTAPDGTFSFRSHRILPPHQTFEATFLPTGTPAPCPPGSLLEFQAERYSGFAVTDTGKVVRGDLIHDPWLLQDVDAEISVNTILQSAGFDLPPTPAMVHYAPGVDVVLWTFDDVTQTG